MEPQAQLSQQHPPCRNAKPSNVWSQLQRERQLVQKRSALRLFGPGTETKRHWQRIYGRRPTAMETQEKRQRQKHTHHWQQLTRAQFASGRFPAKFGCQPIKLGLYPLAHTYPANCVRVHFRRLRVYKGSRVAY